MRFCFIYLCAALLLWLLLLRMVLGLIEVSDLETQRPIPLSAELFIYFVLAQVVIFCLLFFRLMHAVMVRLFSRC